eukprot:COSAG06_NODE_55388_length_289_cov_3.857895_1_plen_95_part_11
MGRANESSAAPTRAAATQPLSRAISAVTCSVTRARNRLNATGRAVDFQQGRHHTSPRIAAVTQESEGREKEGSKREGSLLLTSISVFNSPAISDF